MRLILSIIFCFGCLNPVNAQPFDAVLKKRLDDIHERDQRYRGLLSDFGFLNAKQLDSLAAALKCNRRGIKNCIWDLQLQLDSTNLVWVEQIIREKGYPGKTLVGTPANEAAWCVIQHSPKVKKYYPLIEKAGKQGELPMHMVAQMEDRLLTEDNKPQKYGTQAIGLSVVNEANGKVERKMYLWPVADAAYVNARRRAVGFEETAEQNAKRLNAVFDKELTMEKMAQLQVLPEQPMLLPPEIRAKIKKAKELVLPARDIDTSAFTYYQQAGNYSRAGDAANTAKALQKVNPYYLLYISPSPVHFEDLLKKFTLTPEAKDQLTLQYQTAYNTAKAPSYDSFKHFYINIKYLKSALQKDAGQNRDSLEKKLKFYDSVGMNYLRQYVKKYGWPSLAEGSMYAAFIAQRDIEYYYEYLLAGEQAFYSGALPLREWESFKANRRFFTYQMLVKQKLTNQYKKFDLGVLFTGQLPSKALADSINHLVKAKCPKGEWFYVYYTKMNPDENWQIMWWDNYGNKFIKDWAKFHADLGEACSAQELYSDNSFRRYFNYLPCDTKQEKLYLYVIY